MKRKKHSLAEKSYLGVQSKNRESWLGGKTSKAAAVKRCITQVQFGCNRKSSPNPFRDNQRCRPSHHLGRTQDVGSLGMTNFTHNTPQKCKDLLICNSCCYRVFNFDFTNLLNSFKPFGLRKMTSQYRVCSAKFFAVDPLLVWLKCFFDVDFFSYLWRWPIRNVKSLESIWKRRELWMLWPKVNF